MTSSFYESPVVRYAYEDEIQLEDANRCVFQRQSSLFQKLRKSLPVSKMITKMRNVTYKISAQYLHLSDSGRTSKIDIIIQEVIVSGHAFISCTHIS